MRQSAAAVAALMFGLGALLGACNSGSDKSGSKASATTAPSANRPSTTTTPPVKNTGTGATVHFSDATVAAGLVHTQQTLHGPPHCLFSKPNDNDAAACIEERMTGGVAVGDFDGDGQQDLYFTRVGEPGVLYRNNGKGGFTDATSAARLDTVDAPTNGATFADLDNDGDADLVVTTVATDHYFLFINDGRGHFTDEATTRGVALRDKARRGGMSIAVGDYDNDGWLDLHLTAWEFPPTDGTPTLQTHARLLHNQGAKSPGHFVDTTEKAGVVLDRISDQGLPGALPSFSFSSAFVDLDGDGWQDLAVTSDFGTAQLFWNDGDGTFTDGTDRAHVGTEGNAMGSTFGDYDGDGDLDWFVTAIDDPSSICGAKPCDDSHTGNRLYRNEGNRQFADVTDVAAVRDGLWGWGAASLDFDNDGSLDLTMTNGQQFAGTGYVDHAEPTDDFFAHTQPRLWRNFHDGTFNEVAPSTGFTAPGLGKGIAVVDYDSDGDQDVVIASTGARPTLLRNDGGNEAHWLRVDPRGTRSNRDAIGAVVTVVTSDGYRQRREIGVNSHFLGNSERVAYFGLGSGGRSVTTVTVRWPRTGKVTTLRNVKADQVLVVREGG